MCSPSLVVYRTGPTGPVSPSDGSAVCRAGPHRCDEPVAAAVHGLDHPLGLAVVADGPTHLLDPAGDGRFGDEPAAPDGVHQLFLRHHPVPVRDQVDEHVEGLRLQRDLGALPAQLEQRGVQLEVVEAVDGGHVIECATAGRVPAGRAFRPSRRMAGQGRLSSGAVEEVCHAHVAVEPT